MSWNGTGSLYVICDLPQRADKPSVTSFKRWRWGRGGVCFLSFSCCHGYSRVCVPSHALSKQSQSHLYPICHPFSLSDTYCDKMLCMVDWWSVVWRSDESAEVMWLCEWPYCLDWCWLKPLVEVIYNKQNRSREPPKHVALPGERTAERGPTAAPEASKLPCRWGMSNKCLSSTTSMTFSSYFLDASSYFHFF